MAGRSATSAIDLIPFVDRRFSPWSIARSIKDIYGAGHHGALPTSRYYGGYQSGTVEYPVGALPPYTPLYSTFKGAPPDLDAWLRGDEPSGVARPTALTSSPPAAVTFSPTGGSSSDRSTSSLDFRTWFNIEEDWDFAFVEIDDGAGGWMQLDGYDHPPQRQPVHVDRLDQRRSAGSASTEAAITGSSIRHRHRGRNGRRLGRRPTSTSPRGSRATPVRLNYYTDDAYNDEGMFIDDGRRSTVEPPTASRTGGPAGRPQRHGRTPPGLFTNDWVGAYVNPVYERGKLDETHVGYLDSDTAGDYQYTTGPIDTSSLNRDAATIVFANRPGESPFDANYLFLPEKGNNGKKR